jgi:hypothetical protein
MHVDRAGNMTGPQAGPEFRLFPGEPRRAAGVEDLPIAELGGRGHLRHVLDQMRLPLRRHVPVAQDRRHVLQLPFLGLPLRQAAIQNRDVGLSHQAEIPPHPRGRKDADTVIDHHLVPVADTHGAHAAHEFFHRGGHVGQRAAGVGNLVDIEEACAGDMPGLVFGQRVAAHVGKVVGGIEDTQIRVAQMRRQPVGRDKRPRVVSDDRLCHGVISRLSIIGK